MDPQEAKDQLARLKAQAPKREDFPDEESYQEATVGFRHRAGRSISILQSLANPRPSSSPESEK